MQPSSAPRQGANAPSHRDGPSPLHDLKAINREARTALVAAVPFIPEDAMARPQWSLGDFVVAPDGTLGMQRDEETFTWEQIVPHFNADHRIDFIGYTLMPGETCPALPLAIVVFQLGQTRIAPNGWSKPAPTAQGEATQGPKNGQQACFPAQGRPNGHGDGSKGAPGASGASNGLPHPSAHPAPSPDPETGQGGVSPASGRANGAKAASEPHPNPTTARSAPGASPASGMRCTVFSMKGMGKPFGKRFFRGEDGGCAKEILEGFSQLGATTRTFAILKDLAAFIESADADVHVTASVCGREKALIVPVGKPTCPDGAMPHINRTKETFAHPESEGLLPIDSDHLELLPDGVSPAEALIQAVPALAAYARLECSSTGSHIHAPDGSEVRGFTGQHTFFHVKDATDIPRALEVLHKRCILAGLGMHRIAKGGGFLERSPVDQAMARVTQPIFLHAYCDDGYTQRKRVEHVPGIEVLDTRAVLPDPTPEEEGRYRQLVAEAEERMAPEMRAERVRYTDHKVAQMMAAGVPEAKARQAVTVALDGGVLPPEWEVLHGKDTVTVERILAEGKVVWDGKNVRDPVEWDYGSKSVAKIFFLPNGRVEIRSFAHGGRVFTLRACPVATSGDFDDLDAPAGSTIPLSAPRSAWELMDGETARARGYTPENFPPSITITKADGTPGKTHLRPDPLPDPVLGILASIAPFALAGTEPDEAQLTVILRAVKGLGENSMKPYPWAFLHFGCRIPIDRILERSRALPTPPGTGAGNLPSTLPWGALLRRDKEGRPCGWLIESEARDLVVPYLRGRFALNPVAQAWHEWDGSCWSPRENSCGFNRALHDLVAIGCGKFGFKPPYLRGINQLIHQGVSLPLPAPSGPQGLPFRNGVLDLTTGALAEASPGNGNTWCLPYDHDPMADCPGIRAWLLAAMGGDIAMVEFLRAVLAAILYGRADLQKFFYLHGPGGTGKSTFVRLAVALVGKANAHTTDLKNLEENRFESACLYGKRLVVINDTAKYGGNAEVIKAATGGDPLRNERKWVQQSAGSNFVFEGIVLMTANEHLVTTDLSSGLPRRQLTIEFPTVVTEEEKARWRAMGGEEAVLHRELPGLVNWLRGLSREQVTQIINHPPKAAVDSAAQGHRAGNRVLRWVEEHCVPDPGACTAIGVSEQYRRYDGVVGFRHAGERLFPNFLQWCDGERVFTLAKDRFTETLADAARTLGYPLEKKRVPGLNVAGYLGIRLRRPDESRFMWRERRFAGPDDG